MLRGGLVVGWLGCGVDDGVPGVEMMIFFSCVEKGIKSSSLSEAFVNVYVRGGRRVEGCSWAFNWPVKRVGEMPFGRSGACLWFRANRGGDGGG